MFFEMFTGIRMIRDFPKGGMQAERHLAAVLEWIQLAHRKSGDGGISKGYDLLRGRWFSSYPETTGYTIPTLLNASQTLNRRDLARLASSLAEYLLECVTREGGVAHWNDPEKSPLVFDTGQVIFGWLAAYRATNDQRFLEAAERAGNWIVSVQDRSGSWKEHQHLGVEKTIDTRVAWALLELHRHIDQGNYLKAAIQNLEWAVAKQDDSGWFEACAFSEKEDPFTHTLAYTAEGLLECGCYLGEERYVHAARLLCDALMECQKPDGRLGSTYAQGWRETGYSSCLTGNCQMSLLWFSLFKRWGNRSYYDAGMRSIGFVIRTQNLKTRLPNIRGGIPGSYPLFGKYERFKYPNWAAKYFADALITVLHLQNGIGMRTYVG